MLMSEQSEERALEQGHECAMSVLSAHRDRVASLSPGDRLHWWFGFLTAALGAARASLSGAGFGSLRATLAEELDPEAALIRKQLAQLVRVAPQLRGRSTYIKDKVPTKKKG
jgi:hypothetical protein